MLKKISFILLIMFIFLSYSYAEGSELKISVKTKTYNGKYWRKKHENAMAIWLEDKKGNLVKTLEVWGEREASRLFGWTEKLDTLDIVASPTRRKHGEVNVVWDLKDDNGALLPAGKYILFLEMTEENLKGKSKIHKVKFKIADKAFKTIDNGNKFFKDLTIEYTP